MRPCRPRIMTHEVNVEDKMAAITEALEIAHKINSILLKVHNALDDMNDSFMTEKVFIIQGMVEEMVNDLQCVINDN